MKQKVLFTTPFMIYPAISGPHLRIENSVKALARLSELHVVSRVAGFAIGGDVAIQFYQNLASQFLFSPSVNHLSAKRMWRRCQIVARKCYVSDAAFLVRYAKKHQIKTIWFGFGNLSFKLIRKVHSLAPDLQLICDTDSVWSRFIAREAPFVEDEKQKIKLLKAAHKKEKEEQAWVNLCHLTTAVSEVDAQYYRALTKKQNKVAIFSNGLDLTTYSTHPLPPPRFKRPAIYLAGSFGKSTSAMNRAAQWLLNDILPLIKARIPHVHCYIVGNYSIESFGHIQDPQLTVTGRVDSVLPYLKNVNVALTPLQFESGTRFKILEAAACRIPMVSTTLGAEGLAVKNGEHILIADSTEDFAQAVIRLIEDRAFAMQLADNSYRWVQAAFGLSALEKEAAAILETLA